MRNMHQISKYISHIRCRAKREYALNYLRWLADDRKDSEPAYKCSAMAAQAVRFNLYDLTK